MTDDDEMLFQIFKQGPLKNWIFEEIVGDKLMRFAQAYLMMARAQYRPAAPSDGCGNIQLTSEQYADKNRLYLEAVTYAMKFASVEDGDMNFHIGCSNYNTNRAFVFCIEAARLLAGGSEGDKYADHLLGLAREEIAAAQLLKRRRAP